METTAFLKNLKNVAYYVFANHGRVDKSLRHHKYFKCSGILSDYTKSCTNKSIFKEIRDLIIVFVI